MYDFAGSSDIEPGHSMSSSVGVAYNLECNTLGSTFNGWSISGPVEFVNNSTSTSNPATIAITSSSSVWISANLTITSLPPVVQDRAVQLIEIGQTIVIDLNPLVDDFDTLDQNITWSAAPAALLTVVIDNGTKKASITADALGPDTVVLTATDPENNSDSGDALFRIIAPPVVGDIPDREIVQGDVITINLDNYVADLDTPDDQIAWSHSGNANINVNIVARVATVTVLLDWTGQEIITFTATDPDGLSDSDIATFFIRDNFVASGDSWKYLDNGTNQGTAWSTSSGFDDSTWLAGPSELGYGDGDEATTVGYGSFASSKYVTTYFRRSFEIGDASSFNGKALRLSIKRDDGVVVYLNGTEVFRDNLPPAPTPIAYDTLALTSIFGGAENALLTGDVDTALLVNGTNVLAVEIHQNDITSTDISFDLELLIEDPGLLINPYLQRVTKDSIVIMWETNTSTASLVEYNDGGGWIQVTGSSNTVEGNTIHEVEITGLTSNTVYPYRVSIDGMGAPWEESPDLYFKTAPNASEAFRVVIYGDTRGESDGQPSSGYQDVVASILSHNTPVTDPKPDILLHVGDFVFYGQQDHEPWLTNFFAPSEALLVNTPLFPVLGNHEYSGNGEMWYKHLFSVPENGAPQPADEEKWYAFTYGCARFIVLDDNPAGALIPGSPQHLWLTDSATGEFESTEFQDAIWKFVIFHDPPYTSANGKSGSQQVRDHLVSLFEQYGVDMVFSGHAHNYERLFKDGVNYIVTGAGGAATHGFGATNQYSEVRIETLEHCVLDITPTSLEVKVWDNVPTDIDSVHTFNVAAQAGGTIDRSGTILVGRGSTQTIMLTPDPHDDTPTNRTNWGIRDILVDGTTEMAVTGGEFILNDAFNGNYENLSIEARFVCYGDVGDNAKVDPFDAVHIFNHLNDPQQHEITDPRGIMAADVDGIAGISFFDAANILNRCQDQNSQLPDRKFPVENE